eukprot:COSAG02_NODE_62027_length_267_cov_0.607143_1_plen_21_part_10
METVSSKNSLKTPNWIIALAQ